MKAFMVALMVLAMGFCLVMAYPDDDSPESFYESCINQRISNGMRNASWIRSNGQHLEVFGQRAIDEVSFYELHKDLLLDRMVKQRIEKDPQKAEYFLIEAYADFRSPRSLASRH